MKTYLEEKKESEIWEFWLHKVFDKSLEEFKETIKKTNTAAPTQKELKETVQATFDMLDGFSLRGGAQDGDISAAGDSSD